MTATIGGPGIRGLDALSGEKALCQVVAEHCGGGRSFEGKLFITNLRILFLPFEAERILDAESIKLFREDIAEIAFLLPGEDELLPPPELHICTLDDRAHNITVAFYKDGFSVLQEGLGIGG